MKLNDFIQTLDKEQKIKIGTEQGSNFFFAGTVKQYREWGWGYTRELKRRLEKDLYEAEKRLERAERTRGKLPETELLVSAGKASVELAKWKLKTFKPLGDREVLDKLTASVIADEDTPMILNVEGTEDGAYWTIAEAEKMGEPFSLHRNYRLAAGLTD